jgi:L-ascorbate metabolism protein UlaG (beta-lactamase superfamily)
VTRLRLAPAVYLSVEYSDANEFGSPMASKLEASLRELMTGLSQQIRALPLSAVVARGGSLLEEFRNSERFRCLLDSEGRLADRILYPDPALCKPTALQFTNADTGAGFRFEVGSTAWPIVHEFIALLAGDEGLVEDDLKASAGYRELERTLVPQLAVRDMVVRADSNRILYQESTRSEWSPCAITWLGHNTAVVRSKEAAVLVDPWLLPTSTRYPENYLPAQRAELGRIAAIVITHSHRDHFDPATLLQFKCDTPVIVPRVERESLLAAAMKTRLVELGFTDVRELDWWESMQIGDIDVVALPFYGEQPTSEEQLIPEVRNTGNAYLLRTPQISCAFTADCGRDSRGDVRDVALEAYRRFGSVDFLFSGYRGWRIYPFQLVESSVAAYLLFVPPGLYTVRQSLMSDAAEAIDTAEHWHARYFIPYADGGAPWFWEIGLGPVLDCSKGQPQEWLHFDPMPERVLNELSARSAPTPATLAPSPVQGMLMRAGESISILDGCPQILRASHHTWPWKAPGQDRDTAAGQSA